MPLLPRRGGIDKRYAIAASLALLAVGNCNGNRRTAPARLRVKPIITIVPAAASFHSSIAGFLPLPFTAECRRPALEQHHAQAQADSPNL